QPAARGARAGPGRRDHRGGTDPPAADPDDDGGDGPRRDAAHPVHRRRREGALLDRPCDRGRHEHWHDLHAVRGAALLYAAVGARASTAERGRGGDTTGTRRIETTVTFSRSGGM